MGKLTTKEAENLHKEGLLTDETREQILQKAHGQAQNVSSKLPAEATTDDAPAEKPDAEPKADVPAEKADAEKTDAPAAKPDAE